jgi:hypothetical protein
MDRASLPPPTGIPADLADKFEELALRVASRGFSKYSARAILHQIRWFERVERGNAEFRVNNNISRPLADWWMSRWPEYGRFFETRDRHSVDDEADETHEIGGAS